MKKFFLCFLLLLPALSVFCAEVPPEDRKAVEARAAELAPLLPPEPVALIPPITDREKWEAFARLEVNAGMIRRAEQFLNEPIPELPEELYKEYYGNGNRTNYQNQWNLWRNRCLTLAMAEMAENQGRFLPALEEILRKICAYPSWALPAHDRGAEIYDGKTRAAGLSATNLGGNLAMIARAMEPVLSPELRELIVENVMQRVLEPLRAEVNGANNRMMWWVMTTNNWNAVCFCGSTAAALSICDSPEERAWFLAAAEHFMSTRFLRGFDGQGYCSEGIAYWNYGFGNFAEAAEIAWRGSQVVNLYACPKVRAITEYALKMEVAPERYPAFADCSLTAIPDRALIALLSRRLGLGLTEIEQRFGFPHRAGDSPIVAAAHLFSYLDAGGELPALVPSEGAARADYLVDPVSWFPEAGIVICRPPKGENAQMAAVFKGGNNGEKHNHNDIGTFVILRGGVWLAVDPGGETYSRRTFSGQRYEGELLNSFGHPVPRINGKLQVTGKKAAADVIEAEFTDSRVLYTLDLSSAYPDSGAQRVLRRFVYERAPAGEGNRVTVVDTVTFAPDAPRQADFPLITFEDWKKESANSYTVTPRPAKDGSVGPGIRVTATAVDEEGEPVVGELVDQIVGKDDPQTPNKPTRIAWSFELTRGRTFTVTTVIE
jgi:hypothetical protein